MTGGVAAMLLLSLAPGSVEDCDARVLRQPASTEAHLCFHAASRRTADPSEARRRLAALRSLRPDDPRVLLALGRIDFDRYALDDARRALERSVEGFASAGDSDGEFRAALALVELEALSGHFEEAQTWIERAERSAPEGDPLTAARLDLARGHLRYESGDIAGALRVLERATASLPAETPPDLRGELDLGLGYALGDASLWDAALESFRSAAAAFAESGDWFREAWARTGVARMTGMRHDHLSIEAYREEHARAVEASFASGNLLAEGKLRLLQCHDWQLPVAERVEHARRAMAIFERLGLDPRLAEARLEYSQLWRKAQPDQRDAADRMRDEALELARRSHGIWQLIRGLIVRADQRWHAGDLDGGLADALEAIEHSNRIRDLQRDDLVQAWLGVESARMYYRWSGRLLRRRAEIGESQAIRLAFELAERLRARVLLARLDAAGATAAAVGVSPVRRQRDELLRKIAGLQRGLLVPGQDAVARSALLAELERLEAEERFLRNELAAVDPAFERLRPPEVASLEDVQRALGEDEAMVAFQLATGKTPPPWGVDVGGSWAFTITRDAVSVAALPDRKEVEDAVAILLGMDELDEEAQRIAVSALYDRLFAPALRDLPAQVARLAVVPDGVLHGVSLDTLRETPDSEPFVNRYEWSYVPSATLWLRLRAHGARNPGASVIALADPPAPSAGSTEGRRGSAWLDVTDLGPLPFARREGRAAVKRLGGSSRLRAGREASERWIKTEPLETSGILHFATHAIVDDEHPDRSAILLAPGDDAEDGLLQTREIVEMDLEGRLVVLSACESASGKVVRGEGPLGLARAFFQAGARTVVASLRPLRDDEAARLMDRFYERLAQGRSVAGALAEAKRERLREGLRPAAWDSLVVLGDGSMVPLPGGVLPPRSPARFVVPLTILASAFLAVAAWRTYRRRTAVSY